MAASAAGYKPDLAGGSCYMMPEIYDEEDGRAVRSAPTWHRTSAEAWQAGSAVLDQHDTSEC